MVTKWKTQPYDVKKAHIEMVSRLNAPVKFVVDDTPRKTPQFSTNTSPKHHEPPLEKKQVVPHVSVPQIPKKVNSIVDLFVSPSTQPIVHSSRKVSFRSLPYGEYLSRQEKEFLDRSFDAAVMWSSTDKINVDSAPFNIKNGIWTKLVAAKKLDVTGIVNSYN